MANVQGIGGIFFRNKDNEALQQWYADNLGITPLSHSPWGSDDDASLFEWRDLDNPDRKCYTVFMPLPDDPDEFGGTDNQFMFNFRVDDLDAMLTDLKKVGTEPISEIKNTIAGRFVLVKDPAGNPFELWEPAEGF